LRKTYDIFLISHTTRDYSHKKLIKDSNKLFINLFINNFVHQYKEKVNNTAMNDKGQHGIYIYCTNCNCSVHYNTLRKINQRQTEELGYHLRV